jgi:hypothetical protein
MTQRGMIAITPGTKAWDAWLAYHRGTKVELQMRNCRRLMKPFMVWSPMPPARADASRVTRGGSMADVAAAITKPIDKPAPIDIDAIAIRVEARVALDEAEAEAAHDLAKKRAKASTASGRAFRAVIEGGAPSLKGLPDFGVKRIVDPFEAAEVRNGKRDPVTLKVRTKLTSLRDDPVGRMERRNQITPLQCEAARVYQGWLAAAEIGGARGIDPTRERVDGGLGCCDPNTDARARALKALHRVDVQLGVYGAQLARRVLGDKMEIKRVAEAQGNASAAECERLGWRFREVLTTMIDAAGLATQGKSNRVTRDQHAELAKLAHSPELHRAAVAAKPLRPDRADETLRIAGKAPKVDRPLMQVPK